ncbi:MAG: FMN-binding protein [Cytophagales bacterium]
MSNSAQIAKKSNTKMLRAMVGIGAVCAFLIVLTYESTFSRIQTLRENALQEAIFKVIPGTTTTKSFELKDGSFVELKEKKSDGPILYAGYNDNDELIGFAIPAEGQGYADVIRILYGYEPEKQTIIGMYVLESKETPGLGDKIEKDEKFRQNFTALYVKMNEENSKLINSIVTVKSGTKNNPWEVDGITGATISSRAIGDILDKSANHWLPIIEANSEEF